MKSYICLFFLLLTVDLVLIFLEIKENLFTDSSECSFQCLHHFEMLFPKKK